MIASAGSLVLLTLFLCTAVCNALTAPRLSRPPVAGAASRRPRVSLLVPVRNEAVNLRRHLPTWTRALAPGDQLMILDDQSTDGSALVARAGGADVVPGRPPPDGWVGKSWACHQLAALATGDVLIFVDADVAVDARAVIDTAAWIGSGAADAVSAMPRQAYGGLIDRAVVPFVMHLPIWCTLPLILVPTLRHPAVSAANGQWMAFNRRTYDQIGGHASVRNIVAEDVALGRLVKARGRRLVFALATDRLVTRMYGSWTELRDGFARSMFALCAGRTTTAMIVLGAHVLANLSPALVFVRPTRANGVAIGLLIVVRGLVAGATGGGGLDLLLHGPGAILSGYVFVRSWVAHRRGWLIWRDRKLDPRRIN